VSGAIKVRSLQSEPMRDASTQQDALHTTAFLAALFGRVCADAEAALALHSSFASSVGHCIGDYGAWFGRVSDAPLEAALKVLLRFMTATTAAQPASTAFRNLCVRCTGKLANAATVPLLIKAAAAALSTPGSWSLHCCVALFFVNFRC
jgi:hypothetical protein